MKKKVKNTIIVYVKADIETCKKRNYKSVYEKTLKGELKNITGISDVYEEPQYAEIIIDTDEINVDGVVQIIEKYIKKKYIK